MNKHYIVPATIMESNFPDDHKNENGVFNFSKKVEHDINNINDMTIVSEARFNELLEAEMKLMALEGAGVDNWQGYDDALNLLEEMKKETE